MANDVLMKIISKLLRVGSSEKLEKILRSSNIYEVRQLFSVLDPLQKNMLIQLLFAPKSSSRVVRDFSSDILSEIFNNIPREIKKDLMIRLEPDNIADLVRKLPGTQSEGLMADMDSSKKTQILKLLTYEQGTAGSMMNPNFFSLHTTDTVKDAIQFIRTKGQVEMVFYLYVVDTEKKLSGIVSLRHLIMSQEEALIKDIMSSQVISVKTDQSQAEVARMMSRNNFLSIPAIDEEGHLLGVITIDDVIDLIQEEAQQELYRMSGVEKNERVSTPVRRSILNRAPWLVINLGTAILASLVVNHFEGTIQKVVLLATFMPVVAGMGGNAGAQTLTVIIRALALGEFTFQEAKKALNGEISVGVANGIITGCIMAVVAYLWKGSPVLGLVLMCAMIGNLFISSAVGVVVPLALKALRIDPAMASSVIVTTFTDCFGFFLFLGLATMLLTYLVV